MSVDLTDVNCQQAIKRFFRNRAPVEADELTQQTLLHVLLAKNAYRGEVPARSYVLAIARKTWISHIRRRARWLRAEWDEEALLPDAHTTSATDLAGSTLHAQVMASLSLLSEDLRAVVELTYLKQMTRDDAARVLGVPAGTVSSRLRRALATLRERLSQGETS